MSMHALFLHGVASSIRLPEDHEIAEKKILEAKICERVIKSKVGQVKTNICSQLLFRLLKMGRNFVFGCVLLFFFLFSSQNL